MADLAIETKLLYFQSITGLTDPDLAADVLSAHNWDLDLAISSITADPSTPTAPLSSNPSTPNLAWKLAALPYHAVSGGLGLISWLAAGALSHSLHILRLTPHPPPSPTLSPSAAEAAAFIAAFGRAFPSAPLRPNFAQAGFTDALRRAKEAARLLFVYFHSPDHPDTQGFCSGCLCSEPVAAFLNENFVCWGGSVRASEGYKMSNSFRVFRFPFCAIVDAVSDTQIVLLQQIEGPISPETMLMVLQRVIEECSQSLLASSLEAEERATNERLRQEQDAEFRAALEVDRARERQRKEEQERLEREAAEAERKHREEEEARDRAAREAAEKEAALAKRRLEKYLSLGVEPEKGPDVTQVQIRFSTGERKERRFHSSATIESLYEFVDSLDCLTAEKYILVSNFPRVSYGLEKHSLTLKETGLHPQAILHIETE